MVVDDEPGILALVDRFASQRGFDVVRRSGGRDALASLTETRPDVLLVDVLMDEVGGLDMLRTLRGRDSDCPIILMTGHPHVDAAMEAVKLGARGLVLKESSPETLVACVRRVYQGEQWIDQDTVTRAFRTVLDREAATREAAETLTTREIEIVRMIGQGMRNRVIADRLSISEGTVKVHLHNIYEKLAVDGRLELVLFAQQKGLI